MAVVFIQSHKPDSLTWGKFHGKHIVKAIAHKDVWSGVYLKNTKGASLWDRHVNGSVGSDMRLWNFVQASCVPKGLL